ncbi:hypothetical protein BKA70DRAFT_1141957 [Coprinopsis sp. MPI-PUGE-AT-0042]|nr:hypothetical protein BKA70DRAFT_1141957 [Coprinopsis sp. MPI-PUGE-AT-0042]
MTYPWRTATNMARRFVESHGTLNGNVVVARAEEGVAKSGKLSPEDATSVALGVTFSVLGLALIGLAIWFYVIKPRRQQKAKTDVDVEAGNRSWWMVTDTKGDGEKGGSLAEWWRKSYAVPDRVEPPPTPATAGPRTSIQRFRSILTRKGALRGVGKTGDVESQQPPMVKSMIPSPTLTIDLPIQAVPQSKPRYPSVLERGYRVPLYPTTTPPKEPAGSRSLTSPGDALNGSTTSVSTPGRPQRPLIGLPPRSLKASNGRLLNPIAEHRKSGQPRSPAHRRRVGFNVNIGQFKHPFIPLKDSDTDFPVTISGPLPSAETAETNPKLGYPVQMPRMRTAVPGPRINVARANSRRVPAPVSIQTAPIRPLMPITPHHLREDTRILPPGQSAGLTRPAPTPI